MSRLFLVSSLFAAVLAWPATAAAQRSDEACRLVYAQISNGMEGGRIVRRELRGAPDRPVEVICSNVLLIAQEIDHLLAEDYFIARGDVVFQQTGTRITAARGEFDRKTGLGFFEDASGTLQLTDKQIDRSLFNNQEPEAIFVADRIEKTGKQSYRLTNALFSACVQPTRRWEVTAST